MLGQIGREEQRGVVVIGCHGNERHVRPPARSMQDGAERRLGHGARVVTR
jgi:hypothetical protein